MEEKRNIYGVRILLSMILSIIVFMLVFYISDSFVERKNNDISNEQQNMYYTFILEQLKLESTNTCNYTELDNLSIKLDEMGSYLTIIERALNKNDDVVLFNKEVYSSLEVQHMILFAKSNKKCNNNTNIILFFYTNNEEYGDNANIIGNILTHVKKDNPNVMVYSFDYDIDFVIINYLKEQYNVTMPNTVIINSEKFESLKNVNEVYSVLK